MSYTAQQATVHDYSADDATGEVIMDNGRVLPFSADVMHRSGLRLLRIGQRLNFELGADGIERLWLDGIGSGQKIR